MTMVNHSTSYPQIYGHLANSSSLIMDKIGERVGNVQQILHAGNITKIQLYIRTHTSADTLKVSLQTVGMDTGLPSGTLLNANAYGTYLTSGTGWIEITLAGATAVTAGQWVALVIEWNSYVSGSLSFYSGILLGGASYQPYTVTDVTASPGTWIKQTITTSSFYICSAFEYSDGFHNNALPQGQAFGSALSVSDATTPDEVGNYFQVPAKMRAYGFWIYGDFDNACTFYLLGADDTILATTTYDPDVRGSVSYAVHRILFDGAGVDNVTLNPGTWYRVVLTGGATANAIYYVGVPSASAMAVMDGGVLCYSTAATNRDAVDDWVQDAAKRYCIGILIDQIDDGSGGGAGGGGHVLGRSGVR